MWLDAPSTNTVDPRISKLRLCEHPDYVNSLHQRLRNRKLHKSLTLQCLVHAPGVRYIEYSIAYIYSRPSLI